MYIESTGSETDDEFSSGFQCRLFSLAAQPATTGASMGVTMVAHSYTSGWSVAAGLCKTPWREYKTDEEVDGM